MTQNLILEAARLAKEAHHGQLRKWTGRLYIEHPMRVAGRVMLLPDVPEEAVCAALLHDLKEDRPKFVERLYRETPEGVINLVNWLTNPSKGLDLPRAVRKSADRKYLSYAPYWAKCIKLIDRIDNIQDMGNAPAVAEDFDALLQSEEGIVGSDALHRTMTDKIRQSIVARQAKVES